MRGQSVVLYYILFNIYLFYLFLFRLKSFLAAGSCVNYNNPNTLKHEY